MTRAPAYGNARLNTSEDKQSRMHAARPFRTRRGPGRSEGLECAPVHRARRRSGAKDCFDCRRSGARALNAHITDQ
jgi:hypothetical protein